MAVTARPRPSMPGSGAQAPQGARGARAPQEGAGQLARVAERLSRQSVARRHDAYADVPWDDPELAVDGDDGRWELQAPDPLAATGWYRALPAPERARVGLHRIAATMRTGWEFENVLQRGLLLHAFWMANGCPEFRYLHHEVAEESHHTMMFQELVNRSGIDARGLPRHLKLAADLAVVPLARLHPALFFFFVLGGEEPIDHVQRQWQRQGIAHPLLARIVGIHVAEEARHLSFARHYLADAVPRLGRVRRRLLAVEVPLVLGVMVRLMLGTPRRWAREAGVPAAAVRAAARSHAQATLRRDAVSRARRLTRDLGLTGPAGRLVWRAMGIWAADAPATAAGPERGGR